MFAILGLGNPGSKYADTRHNVGFWTADLLHSRFGFHAKWERKFDCEYCRVSIGSADALLIKPQRYMNLSGEASLPLLRYFRIEPSDLIVIYDELDLEPGVLRVRQGGSAGGHNGLEDVIRHAGTGKFARVRIGIGHPFRGKNAPAADPAQPDAVKPQKGPRMDVSDWVLSRPKGDDLALIRGAVEQAADAAVSVLEKGVETAQQLFNRKQ